MVWLSSLDSMFSEDGQVCNKTWTLYPPQPIKRQLYRCDSEFHTEKLYSLYDTGDKYLVLFVKGHETVFIEYKRLPLADSDSVATKILGRYSVRIARNHDQGGQSQNRIERLRQIQIHEYLKSVNERALQYVESDTWSGLILAGAGTKKDELLKGPLDSRLKDMCLGTVTCDSTISHCYDKINSIIDGINGKEIAARWDQFMDILRLQPDSLTFGKDETLDALDESLLKEIYIPKRTDQLERRCQAVGCTIVEIGRHASEYGDICGVKWY